MTSALTLLAEALFQTPSTREYSLKEVLRGPVWSVFVSLVVIVLWLLGYFNRIRSDAGKAWTF
jgi:hypothetical protein